MIDDHEGGVGNVDTDLDNGSGDEDVEITAGELAHGDFFLGRGEAAVKKAEAEAGEGASAELVIHVSGGAEFLPGEEGNGLASFLICNFPCSLRRGWSTSASCFGDEAGGDGVRGRVRCGRRFVAGGTGLWPACGVRRSSRFVFAAQVF